MIIRVTKHIHSTNIDRVSAIILKSNDNKLSVFYDNYIWYNLNLYIHHSIYTHANTVR